MASGFWGACLCLSWGHTGLICEMGTGGEIEAGKGLFQEAGGFLGRGPRGCHHHPPVPTRTHREMEYF